MRKSKLKPLTEEQQAKVEANLGLAYQMAHHLKRHYRWLSDDDLQAACFDGLCRGVRRHDPAKGALSTCACRHMRHAVQMLVHEEHTIHMPSYTWHVGKKGYTPNHQQADKVRAMQRIPGEALRDVQAQTPKEDQQLSPAIRRAIASLSDRRREVITRIFLHGESQQQIANEMGCLKTNVSQIKQRALAELREILEATR